MHEDVKGDLAIHVYIYHVSLTVRSQFPDSKYFLRYILPLKITTIVGHLILKGPLYFVISFIIARTESLIDCPVFGSFSIYEQPKWERIVASTQVGFRVSIWGRIRVRVRVRIRVRVRVRLGLYFGCSYIEKGPSFRTACHAVSGQDIFGTFLVKRGAHFSIYNVRIPSYEYDEPLVLWPVILKGDCTFILVNQVFYRI